MTSRRPSFARNPRPSSAIFIGSDSIPPLPSPPSPAHSSSSTRSQLPSPPATNSTGSIGDNNSTGTGSVRRSGMINGDRHPSLSDEEDDHNEQENDEDHTARLSNDRRAAKGKQPEESVSTIQRVRSLTERNRKVIDRLSSITASDSHSRSSLSSPSGASSSRSRSPLPPTFSSSSSSSAASSSSRVSFSASLRGGSGSETEREREQGHANRLRPAPPQDPNSDDNDAVTPPATARRPTPTFERTAPRQRLRSAPSSPAKPPVPPSPRKHTSTTNFAVIGSGRRSRRVSIQQPDDVDEEDGSSPTHPTIGGSTNKKSRAPLPREFRERRSLDGRSTGEPSNGHPQEQERTTSPGMLTARGAASANSSGAGGTFSASPASPRSQRPARPSTVRESSRRLQRWNSVDDAVINGDEEGRKQWRHAGSAESPLGGKEGRSVVGEGLRAAGLARRGSEDVFVDGVSQRRARNSVGLPPNGHSATGGELDELRRGITRGLGLPEDPRDPRTPHTAPPGSGRYGTARSNTIHSVLSGSASRAGTSMGSYAADDDVPRATSQPLRSHRTSYGPGTRHTPQSRVSPAVGGTFGRGTPLHSAAAMPSSEHARLLLDSLAMFEAQLSRLPPGPPDLVRTAQSVVQSASGLNTLLRAGNTRALEAQIEAEVGDAAAQVDASEVWRQIGGEYRESVRVSDELVRTVTALLLGVGRLVREAVKERSTDSPDNGGGGGSGRSSLDGGERDRAARAPRRSMDADGRSSVDGSSIYRESRRSWEDGEGSRRPPVDLTSRPPTSLSMTRRQDDGNETARERDRDRSSTLERLSIRRMFSPRSRETNHAPIDSLDPSYPSPSPAPRSSLDRGYREREQHRSLPPLSVPPPLPSLPSESLLDRRGSMKGRRAKVSNTSTATVRGTSIFPTMTSPPNPTTALTPHTVSADEATAFPLLRRDSSSSALSGLQQQQQRDVRKRTISATSAQDSEAVSGSSGSSETRAQRGTRIRMSLDSSDLPPDLPPALSNGDRRERRRTINEIFP